MTVFRGDLDVSSQCERHPGSPSVVRFAPERRSLVGVSPGTSAVDVALGDKVPRARRGVPAGVARGRRHGRRRAGQRAYLAPGQLHRLRVF